MFVQRHKVVTSEALEKKPPWFVQPPTCDRETLRYTDTDPQLIPHQYNVARVKSETVTCVHVCIAHCLAE